MFQNAAIDVAIALILMYLMLSLLCTVINEYIATRLKLRATALAQALEKFLDHPPLREAFYKNGLIVGSKQATATGQQSMPGVDTVARALTSGVRKVTGARPPASSEAAARSEKGRVATASASDREKDHPSYLSSRSVALALIGSLDTGKPVPGIEDIRAAVTTRLPDSGIRDVLLASLTEAGNDLDKLRTSIATWFDNSMERLGGAYKRKLKLISFLIGLGVTVVFNADSVTVAKILWSDGDRRAAIAAVATEVAKERPKTPSGDVDDKEVGEQIKKTESTLRLLPIGWDCGANPVAKGVWDCVKTKLVNGWNDKTRAATRLLGLFMTTAALTLGAPFWFDTLQKFVNLRGAGAKPKREDEKEKEKDKS
jgi:hypothetical protein